MHRVLVPLDGSPFSESALPLAGEIAERTGRNLELVTVKPSVGHLHTPPGMSATIESAHGVGARLRSAVVHRCDLVAMATRGLGGVQRMFLGSVADKVIRCAATPVLVVNPSAGASSRVLGEQLAAATAGQPFEDGAGLSTALR